MKKQFRSLCLAVLLLSTLLCTPVLAANDSQAGLMTLEKTEGSYAVENQRGKELKIRTGGRLYNGYRLSTGEGYAWIGLDDEKLIKLDWNTQVIIKKAGKRLEVMLESGELFFDVSKPLEKDEQLYIRTSTMFTGIRGTSGVISTRENGMGEGADMASGYSSLTVLDGKVRVTRARQKDLSRMDTYLVGAGWRNDVALRMTGSENRLQDTQLASSLKPINPEQALEDSPFAAREVAGDPALQKRIEEANGGRDLTDTLKKTDSQLADRQEQDRRDNAAADKRAEDKRRELEAGSGNPENPVFPPPPPEVYVPTVNYYVVSYMVKGPEGEKSFAKQSVEENKPASEPRLLPSPAEDGGFWSLDGDTAYDFSRPVKQNLILSWVIPKI